MDSCIAQTAELSIPTCITTKHGVGCMVAKRWSHWGRGVVGLS
uniref:Uncharacterized protein n=1 Tax=Rhizophora mucronata TaxID=61149 RepID=A0A2P2QI85_RHIMU